MPLALGVVEGDKIYIDDDPLVITRIESIRSIVATFKGREYVFRDDESIAVRPSVFISVGIPKDVSQRQSMMARLVFDAPKSVSIKRRQLYEGSHTYPRR